MRRTIRVVSATDITNLERDGSLPEIVTLGPDTVYQVIYSEVGAAEGAVRSTDPDEVIRWREFIQRLYASGEDIAIFFDRAVAGLRPPHTAG
jgi:hypothetical protein